MRDNLTDRESLWLVYVGSLERRYIISSSLEESRCSYLDCRSFKERKKLEKASCWNFRHQYLSQTVSVWLASTISSGKKFILVSRLDLHIASPKGITWKKKTNPNLIQGWFYCYVTCTRKPRIKENDRSSAVGGSFNECKNEYFDYWKSGEMPRLTATWRAI